MGEFQMQPGATEPRDFARAAPHDHDIRSRQASYEVGEPWIDQGGHGHCHGRAGQPGCFLGDDQRAALIGEFQKHTAVASDNYCHALLMLRMETIVEKEDDLSWLGTLLLDVVGMHVLAAALTALKNRQTLLQELASQREVALTGARAMLVRVTPAQIDAVAKLGFDQGKKGAQATFKREQNKAALGAKTATIAFIDTLIDSAAEAFSHFALDVSAMAEDAELVVLWHGMKPEHHHVEAYKGALDEKIGRFKTSGIREIGHKPAVADGIGVVDRARRVVIVQDMHGRQVPWYQQADRGVGAVHSDAPPRETLLGPVPEEFREIAVARSEVVWGSAAVLDDGYSTTFHKQVAHRPANVADAAMQAFGHYTDPRQP